MKKNRLLLLSFCFAGLMASTGAAFADDIDERQTKMMDKINQAAESKQLAPADVKALKKQMAEFNKKKGELRSANGDALSLNDDKQLDKRLNAINNEYEKARKKVK